MKKKIILIVVLAVALLFIDINKIGMGYVAIIFCYIVYMIKNKNSNEIVLAFSLFGYSFGLFLNKLTGIINLGALLGIICLLFGYIVINQYNKRGKLNTSVSSIVVTYSLFFFTVIFSIAFVYLESYQLSKIQLLLLWFLVFFVSINSFDNSINEFNFDKFLILSFFLFMPHFSVAMDKGLTLSPIETWNVYSVLDDGIRGYDFDIISATRIAGIGILAYFIYMLDFNYTKTYLIALIVPFVIMIIICQTRQSIAALFLPMFLFLLYSFMKEKKSYFVKVAVIIFIVFSAYNYLNYLDDNGVKSRVVTAVEGTSEEGTGREGIWDAAIQYINQDKASTGFGNFSFFTNSATYPHNIFLETYIENGSLSLIALILIIAYVIFEMYKIFFVYEENSKLELFLIFATVYYIALAQFSADLSRNLMFFYTFSLFVCTKNNNKNKEYE